jgi:transcriptional regulator with XRE-family HTH domain
MRQENTLGKLVRAERQRRNWTLRQMSEKVGIPLSTLAKVEQDRLSLTYDKLQQMTSRLGVTMAEFLAQGSAQPRSAAAITARRSPTSASSTVHVDTPNYNYQYLCADLRDKRMVPILARIRARTLEEFGELIRHQGEEFVYVLEGCIEVHLQFYTPLRLQAGQGVYVDSTMGHAYIAKDCDSALVLAVCSSEDANLSEALISLANQDAVVEND